MSYIYKVFNKINKSEALTRNDMLRVLDDATIHDFQLTALSSNLLLKMNVSQEEKHFIHKIKEKYQGVRLYVNLLESVLEKCGSKPYSFEYRLLHNVNEKKAILVDDFITIVTQIKTDAINKNFLSIFLMLIRFRGLSSSSTDAMTNLMANSGNIYDYRNRFELNFRKVLRRYPTGALSEKVALIMPSLLMVFSKDLPICSPFIVARSLSFTGGTFDKLMSIPGFQFPNQGEETIDILKKCNISMSITQADFNPVDRYIYEFRSITNTVESKDLIISSIASKQIAVPADALLLDVRHGGGAFLHGMSEAEQVGNRISAILNSLNINTKCIFTDTIQPTGSSIGNYFEVLEAIAIMKNSASAFGFNYNRTAMNEQTKIVVDLTVELLILQFGRLNRYELEQKSYRYLKDMSVFQSFLKLLAFHEVSDTVINKIMQDKNWHDKDLNTLQLISSVNGIITEVDQREIGYFVNFELGGGLNQFTGETDHYSGIILRKRVNDYVRKGEVLAEVISDYSVKHLGIDYKKFYSINDKE